MDTVIPADVMRQLAALHDSCNDLTGWWRSEDLRRVLGVGKVKGGKIIREWFRDGVIERRRFALSDAQATEIGLLGGAGVIFYRFAPTDASDT